MTHQTIGYKRVSSSSQNTDRQLVGIALDKEFVDIMSGCSKDRQGLKECMEYVRQGDLLVIDSIDRLARNLHDLQELIDSLVKKGVSVQFIKENLTFNSKSDPMSSLMLQMMGAFAEFERTMIKARQREGIDAAKKAGKHMGRPAVITKKLVLEAKCLKEQGISIRQIGFRLKVSRPSVYKMLEA
jgi:DNA invertase Pin-like site-specific DNA recombinase